MGGMNEEARRLEAFYSVCKRAEITFHNSQSSDDGCDRALETTGTERRRVRRAGRGVSAWRRSSGGGWCCWRSRWCCCRASLR